MRERRGSFEVVLTDGQRDVLDEPEGGASYTFRALSLDEKLVAGLECTLRGSDAERLVRIDRIDGAEVTLWSERSIALKDGNAVLVIYPWFLYERLLKALEETCQPGSGGQSRINVITADVCVDLARRAMRAGAESVAIITPYVDQARAIRARLKQRAGDNGDGRRIECSTVHRFQGQERDVVILDTVDAEPMKPGVLLSERGAHSTALNLINVAISRARGKLIVVADVRYFERRAAGSVVNKMVVRALAVGRREIMRK